MSDLSTYAKSLGRTELDRYVKKLTITVAGDDILLPDPYNLTSGWFADPTQLPPTQYRSIYNYLVTAPGPYTGEALEAYKSLEAYNYFVSGHVKGVKQNNISSACNIVFVKASVEPGQRVTDDPFKPWICLNKEHGYVITSHCTCMAGLGEACSHIAALLFAIESVFYCGINAEAACTSVKCIWADYYKEKRIDYKVIVLAYKALHQMTPYYLCDILSAYQPARALGSGNQCQLAVPKTRTTNHLREEIICCGSTPALEFITYSNQTMPYPYYFITNSSKNLPIPSNI